MSEEIENHPSILNLKSKLFTQSSKQEREKRRFWGGWHVYNTFVICILRVCVCMHMYVAIIRCMCMYVYKIYIYIHVYVYDYIYIYMFMLKINNM